MLTIALDNRLKGLSPWKINNFLPQSYNAQHHMYKNYKINEKNVPSSTIKLHSLMYVSRSDGVSEILS
jgi:hypothetical protein